MNYRSKRNYENIQKANYPGVGLYSIPQISPTVYDGCEWIAFSDTCRCSKRDDKGLHFFLDDYRFIRLWSNIDRYIPMLQQFRYVMTPDFSLYTDFPVALQIYNHYRKHWLGAYMQERGINVIPTICWSTGGSFAWCFDGEPIGGCVAVSSVGTQNSREHKKLFLAGYNEMVKRLEPETIIFYGGVPDECKGNIVKVKAFQDRFAEARCNSW